MVVLVAGVLPLVGAAGAWAAFKPQTIEFTSHPPNPARVGGSWNATATATSTKEVAFTVDASSTTGACSVAGSKVSFTGAGACVIDANQAGDAEWIAAPQVQESFTITLKPQTVAFTSSPPNPAVVGGSWNVTATATSSKEVAITLDGSSTAGACSITGSTVSFTGAGTCVVDANQAGDAGWAPAPQTQESFTVVVLKPQTIEFTSHPPKPARVGGSWNATATAQSGKQVAFTVDPSSTKGACSVAGSKVSFTGAGTCAIDANQAGDAEWLPASQVQESFATTKTPQEITFKTAPPTAAVVGGPTYTVEAIATSGQSVVFTTATPSVCSVSGATVSFIGAGACTINASQAGNDNYLEALPVTQSFTVSAPTLSHQTFTPTPTPTNPNLTPKPTTKPSPPATFTFGASNIDTKTGRITFVVSFDQPGAFSWLFTFPNGKFGVYAAQKNAKCASRTVRLHGKCRPANIVFAAGHSAIPGVGRLKVWFKPSASGLKALKNAMQKGRPVLVSATFTFVPAGGLVPVTQTRTFSVKLKKH
jgi:hypothetical protein